MPVGGIVIQMNMKALSLSETPLASLSISD